LPDRNSDDAKVIAILEPSELQKFALTFHQDFDVEYSNYHEAAQEYISELSPARRGTLLSELREFVSSAEQDPRRLRQQWLELGVGYCPRDPTVGLSLLAIFLEMLRGSSRLCASWWPTKGEV